MEASALLFRVILGWLEHWCGCYPTVLQDKEEQGGGRKRKPMMNDDMSKPTRSRFSGKEHETIVTHAK